MLDRERTALALSERGASPLASDSELFLRERRRLRDDCGVSVGVSEEAATDLRRAGKVPFACSCS